nr:UvrD-helicase domain-containing protein [uncultured Massilia sp.]
MAKSIVFSNSDALMALLSNKDSVNWLKGKIEPNPCNDGIFVLNEESVVHFFVNNGDTSQGRVFFSSEVVDYLVNRLQSGHVSNFLQRAHRLVELAKKLPLRIPPDWMEYHAKDLVTFFAAPRSLGNFRWIAQISVGDGDVCFWKITSEEETVDLDNFQPNSKDYNSALLNWNEAKSKALSSFLKCEKDTGYVSLGGAIDLRAATFDAVVRHKTYSDWIGSLNDQQQLFLNHDGSHSVKLRGPAGSGKTLALAVKTLKEVYSAKQEKSKILFVTHSWAMAEQVDEILNALDEKSIAQKITVFPLVEIAKAILPQTQFAGSSVLGNDSYTGKTEQLRRISEILVKLKKTEWPLFAMGCSAEFVNRVESLPGSPKWNSFVWDVMHEFSAVLGAASILPGVNAERKYLALERMDWMMPLGNDGDKRFILKVHAEYIKGLKAEKMLTVDQVINDLLSYLETFGWNYRREDEGYDTIFIDEFHLFTEQERQVLNYLTRDAAAFPRLFMALDPRQSPYEVYVDFPMADVKSRQSGQAERDLGEVNSFDLVKVHRFSPQILELVKFIQYSYPTLDLGDDWLVDVAKWESEAQASAVPKYHQVSSINDEIDATVKAAKNLFVKNGSRRLAIVMLDESNGERFSSALEEAGLPVLFMRSRDDVDNMRYRRKSIVLGAAEYTAGLQFEDVIVTALPDYATLNPIPIHQRRRILSLLYIAISRATETVEIIIQNPADEYSSMLDKAVSKGILEVSS